MFLTTLHGTAMPLSPVVLQTVWTDGADFSLATVTFCSFLSEEHYKQRGTAGIGKGLK